MDTAIPYHPLMLLGRSVNMKTMQPGYMLIGEDIIPKKLKVSLTTSQFSFAQSLKDVCNILSIPPEYALKVKAGVRDIQNELVEACLKDLGKAGLFRIIFRVTFLEQKQYLSPDVVPVGSDLLDERASGGERSHTTESLVAEATADSESSMHDGDSCLPESLSGKSRWHHGTHWVKAIEIGNELVTVMTVSCKELKCLDSVYKTGHRINYDLERLNKLGQQFLECLEAYRGQLDRPKVEALTKLAAKLDKKLSKKHYTDVHLEIQYSSFTELDKYPASITGMVKTIDSFMDQCVGWTERSKHGVECEVEDCVMRCKLGLDEGEKPSMIDNLKDMFSNFISTGGGSELAIAYHPPKETCEVATDSNVDGNNDSFVVLEPFGTWFCYNLRITLQSFKEDNDIADRLSSLALSQYPETTNTMFENVFKLLTNCDEAVCIIQEFLSSKRYLLETHFEEGNKVLKSIQNVHLLVLEIVADLDFVCLPTENTLKNVITTNPLTTVTDFIENGTSKLPPGSDIDLLMIGKTGHGKSSTGNSILGQNKFVSSADGESVTSHSGMGWAEIDGRIIKVVDTPGVCDTKVDGDASSIDLTIKSISQAIASCPEGFHALLNIIRFGTRMTTEERKAIGLLKCILGKDIVRSHCICVLTHGDNFETEIRSKTTFEEWCKTQTTFEEWCKTQTTFEEWCKAQSGYLKDLFEECGYRCVLFNNKATDPKVKKAQLIKLVSMVDSLKHCGTRYTNFIFELVQRERQRIISEEMVPHVNEEMMRDIQLVLEQLNRMVNNTSEATKYRDELSKLKERVDNLNNRGDNYSQSQDLVVFRDEIQKFHDNEMIPKLSLVTEKVSQQVKFGIEEGLDLKRLNKLGIKFCECLKTYQGQLDRHKLEALTKLAAKLDKKLSKKHYTDVHLDIQYSSFTELDKYPASIIGMVKTIDSFMDQCVGWTERSKHGVECEVEACVMRCKPGLDEEEKALMKGKVKHKFSNFISAVGSGQTDAYHPPKETCEVATDSNVDGDNDSFVVLEPSGTWFFYNLRITLQSFKEDNDITDRSSSSSQDPETTNTMFENVFKLLTNCGEAVHLIQEFLSSKRYLLETHFEEGNKVLKSIQNVHLLVLETVADLDFVCIPTENTLKNVITTNPLTTVTDFIENVTSKLPPGSDIDLLMIGKTGHGKSSTGNSILGQNKFVFSADEESVTRYSTVGWAEIDGRIIKVVDTPGVCDTNVDDDALFIDLALNYISQAIASCTEGFHALLLIIHFGTRITTEERKAIGLLKSILGEDIVRSHCICVITHGDDFETDMTGKKPTFEEWCKTRSGYLKDLFEECGYRCVLFNNKATDPKVKKAQLIKLVAKVDSLKDSGTRYTNSIFEFAQRERQRIISEEMVLHVNEEMTRDIQLVLEQLNGMVNNTSEATRYRDELSNLKEKVDTLNNRVTEVENGQIKSLVDTISALTATIQAKMDEIADRPTPDVGATPTETTPKRGDNSSQCQDLVVYRDEIQKYQDDDMTPKQITITEKVTEQVKSKIKEEKQCFPGSSVVMLSNGKSATLEELRVGDKVLVRDKMGGLSFDTVYMFGHQELDVSSEFLALKTASQTVYVTAGHYVYCVKDGIELCVSAENVHVGDCLLVVTGDGLVFQSVQAVTYERKRGLFAPFTNSGNIIVDGVLMSCYIDVLPATMCQTLLWPVRQLYRASPCMLSYINGPSSQHSVPRWAKAVMKLM